MLNEPRWRRYLRFHRANPAADLDDELRDHLQSTIEALVARGVSPEDARAEAHRRFGDVDAVRAAVGQVDAGVARSERRALWLDFMRTDIVFALRQLRRAPGFAIVAVVSIALGVGLNVAIFSLANGLLLRPLPGVQVDGLQRLYVNHHGGFEWRDLAWIRDRATLLESAVGERLAPLSMDAGETPERIVAAFASRGFFQTLRVRMALGRAFNVDERQPGEAVAVLSHAAWQSRFGGDSSIIGKSVRLAGQPFTIVGVASPEFASSEFGWAPELWIPLASMPLVFGTPVDSFHGTFYATVRLRDPSHKGAAAAQLASLAARLRSSDTSRFRDYTVVLDGVRGVNAELRVPAEAATGFLLVMVALVLIIACANVANLLLGRASARRTEIGVRLALGANRARIIRQLLTESLILACIGAAVGLSIAAVIVRMVTRALPPDGLSLSFSPDRNVLLFALLVTAGSVVLFGLAPARRAASLSLSDALRPDSDNVAGRRARLRGTLIGGQMALCTVLLATAALLSESFLRSRRVDPGFTAAGVQDLSIDLGKRVDSAAGVAELERISAALTGVPSVRKVAFARIVPLSGSNMSTPIAFGDEPANPRSLPNTYFNIVGQGYFEALGIPLVGGRDFARTDIAATERVAVINETAARRWWPNMAAIGKRFRWGGVSGPIVQVVGVVRDAKYNSYGEDPTPFVYLAVAQNYNSEVIAHVRTTGTGVSAATLRAAIRAVDPMLPAPTVKPLTEEIALALLPARLGAALLGAFGVVALIIAASGIYGVTSYAVSRRTREIGIRSALGASQRRILGSVIGDGLRTAAIGAALGLLLAIGVALALSHVLYGVSAVDPAMLFGVPVLLTAVAIAACLVPARRAARIDPVTAMRAE